MQLHSTRDGIVATVNASGLIDTRAAQEFERCLVGLYNEGIRGLIVDLSKVDLITSAGLRVLVMMAQRLQRSGGGLALCALSERVRGVLDIAGLLTQFRITVTRDEAIAQLKIVMVSVTATPSASKLARLVTRLVVDEDGPPRAPREAAARQSALTARVIELLQPAAEPRHARTPREHR